MGASPSPTRYAYLAAMRLKQYGHEVIPFGKEKGMIDGLEIQNSLPKDADIDTVTLYLNPRNQPQYYDFLLSLKPKRVIFNPGAENLELETMLESNGIEPVEACTLVMLSTGSY